MKSKIMAKGKEAASVKSKNNFVGVKKCTGKPPKTAQNLKKASKTLLGETSSDSITLHQSPKTLENKAFNFVAAPKKLVSDNQIKNAVSALFQYIENKKTSDTILFDEEKPIFIQITSLKVAKTPPRIIRLSVPHTLLTDSSEICLIVKDIGKPKEHDETIDHYEQLLSKHEISNIKAILPYHQFKTEYGNQFELQRNLLGLYDYFLVDSRVSKYVTKALGHIFTSKRKLPVTIKMHIPNLKTHIEKSLKKTSLKVHSDSDSFIVQAAHTKMEQTEISENVSEIVNQLCNEFPGGADNIRALSIKTDKSIAIPIYLTLRSRNTIRVPIVQSKRPKYFETVRGELTTVLNKEVTVLPSGKVFVNTIANEDEEEDDLLEDIE